MKEEVKKLISAKAHEVAVICRTHNLNKFEFKDVMEYLGKEILGHANKIAGYSNQKEIKERE